MDKLPSTCWKCDKDITNEQNILYSIPSISAYFTIKTCNNEIPNYPPEAIIGFCVDCGYKQLLEENRKDYCETCGLYISERYIHVKCDKSRPKQCTKCFNTESHNEDPDVSKCDDDWYKITNGIAKSSILKYKYKVITDHNGWICSTCFDSMSSERITGVECNICHNKYPSCIDDRYELGSGCSTSLTHYHVRAGYGSIYDNDVYTWSTPVIPKEYRNVKNICDTCIDNFVGNGQLILK